jgi:ketosteroid isomerase-like protein
MMFMRSMRTLCKQPLTPRVLGLQVTQSLNVICAGLAEFFVPGVNSSLADAVLSSYVVDRRPARFAQDLYDLTFRKIHFLHGWRFGCLSVGNLENACAILREPAWLRFVTDESMSAANKERTMSVFRVSLALGLLAFAAAPRGMETSGEGVSDAMPTILRANSDWAAAMRSGNVDAIVSPYANDAVFLTAGGESIRGREAIKTFYRNRLAKARVVSASIHHQGAAAADHGLVYEWGTGVVGTRSPDGAATQGGGPYLTVWKRDEAGVWKILRNVVL